ncbi:hypothetical protein ACFLXB_01780 [Chloroflexota bacterium]
MNIPRIRIMIPMLLILIVSACGPAPQALPTATATKQAASPVVTEAPIVPTDEGISATPTQPEAVMVPTSRGPDLVASDPSLVKLASGQLQLVEFFSFT